MSPKKNLHKSFLSVFDKKTTLFLVRQIAEQKGTASVNKFGTIDEMAGRKTCGSVARSTRLISGSARLVGKY